MCSAFGPGLGQGGLSPGFRSGGQWHSEPRLLAQTREQVLVLEQHDVGVIYKALGFLK